MSPPSSVIVYVGQKVCVAGGVVQGIVELNLRQLQEEQVEEVHVKLRGFAQTSIMRRDQTDRENIDLVRFNTSIWSRGAAYPRPGSHFLTVPFQLSLPPDLPPSFSHHHVAGDATVRYYIEAVGVRPGAFRLNKRIDHPLAVVPSDPKGCRIKTELQGGWQGPWNTVSQVKRIRKGIWGGYADVKMEVVYPMIPIYPLFTNIPFSISIFTTSKSMKRTDSKHWPRPPRAAKEIDFELRRKVYVRAGRWDQYSSERVGSLGGMGDCLEHTDLHIEAPERQWSPAADDKSMGRWKQDATFTSSFQLKCPPTFKFATMSNEYHLHVRVDFGGLFNSLAVDIPMTIASGIVPTNLPIETELTGSTSSADAVSLSPEILDLPPYVAHLVKYNLLKLVVSILPRSYWSSVLPADHKA
ncbi:hypothetical protein WOLCODRAFT_165964 [Wolfiporia cocos MD-104 SS10]|uniref:Arrestin-like N-terminal domain-containing protein n=1 Tax=Wolfiporia cocos (strain MD-104) TaxID=742152 RepID=A0A2H3IYE2_WOLCO|nr:hypothetical protein WOLCODRAFT_165964 [Wolfiporia cocos MD-104 SS10]